MDKRTEKTLSAVYESLSSLLKEKDYEEIKVGDILEKSGVSRGAFYSHFNSKEDVLSSLCDQMFEHVFSLRLDKEKDHDFSSPSADTKHLLTHLAIHFYDDKDIIYPILSSSGKSVFTSRLTLRSAPIMETCVFKHELFKEGVPEKLQSLQLTDSFVSLISHWIRMGCIVSPEKIIEFFYLLHK